VDGGLRSRGISGEATGERSALEWTEYLQRWGLGHGCQFPFPRNWATFCTTGPRIFCSPISLLSGHVSWLVNPISSSIAKHRRRPTSSAASVIPFVICVHLAASRVATSYPVITARTVLEPALFYRPISSTVSPPCARHLRLPPIEVLFLSKDSAGNLYSPFRALPWSCCHCQSVGAVTTRCLLTCDPFTKLLTVHLLEVKAQKEVKRTQLPFPLCVQGPICKNGVDFQIWQSITYRVA
jgi:hypothetical protein